ncbi:hypothetical protein M408DRAFT_25110 [Serendipita vermifera MAFF 305830]|uniref:Uncharacterized protein n=1 Tax=Serendipita vermifera MAFF 305830 TaxID=933852 RepID=A0A0C3B3R7_SERVB|nr:hypothetical protein M408DRAFT_25110 [Serendipita vermifera MAFF 305830]
MVGQTVSETNALAKRYAIIGAVVSVLTIVPMLICAVRMMYKRSTGPQMQGNVTASGLVIAAAPNKPKAHTVQLPSPAAPAYHKDSMYKGTTESLALTRMPTSAKWPASSSRPSSELDPYSPYPPVDPYVHYPPVDPYSAYPHPPGLKPHYNTPVAGSHAY